MSNALIWSIVALAIGGVLLRPRKWPEAIWACLGALLLVLFRLIFIRQAVAAIGKGLDVYLFLTGMMLLAELARHEGVFDWLATQAVRGSHGSGVRLFALVYAVGILVTAFLSNDATAVVLTPAVYAAVKKAKAKALPYLFVCAFIANAASFVLPISNPANLVVYGSRIPPLFSWLRLFAVPSVLSIAATFLILRYAFRAALQGAVERDVPAAPLNSAGRRAAWGLLFTGLVLIAASALGRDLGLPTCVAAIIAVIVATRASWKALGVIFREVSWSVIPLVAGLFVLVEGLNSAGGLRYVADGLRALGAMPPQFAALAGSFGAALLSNVMNNLPSGLLTGAAAHAVVIPYYVHHALLLGVDLGPNLSVTGSLATILWLIALRREGEHVSGWQFLKLGCVVMPPSLLLATLALTVFPK
jgi:arsenical pump membrane protein